MNTTSSEPRSSLPAAQDGSLNREAGNRLSVKDLADVLRSLSSVFGKPASGSPELARALVRLSKVLQRYGDRDLEEVLSGLTVKVDRGQAKRHVQPSLLKDVDVGSLDLTRARVLLLDDRMTKADLIRLGNERFGISGSRLQRENRDSVKEAIEAAIRNTEALHIIAEEASRAGARRSS